MKVTDYLAKNRDNISYYTEVKKIIDDLKEYRGNLGTILEYCHQNLMCFDLEKREEIQLELLKVLENDKTYCVLYHLIKSDFEKKETASTPYWVDESNVTERYHANLVKEQENDNLYTLEWWRELEQQAKQAIEQENSTAVEYEKIIPDNLLIKLQKQGFIENSQELPLKWLKKKALLAYFADVANDKLNLKYGEKRQIRPFETLFNVSGLTSAINDYKKTGDLPVGYKDIDKLFI